MHTSPARLALPSRLSFAALALFGFAACQPRTGVTPNRDSTIVSTGDVQLPRSDSAMAGSPMAKATPQMLSVIETLVSLGGKSIETLTPAEARMQPTPTDAVKALLEREGKPTTPPPGVKTVDRTIPGPAGPLPVRVYTPESGTGPFPIIVYFHGGGWVIANKEVYDAGARALSLLTNAVVLSVDYRLGPEHKFPAAHDDALASYEWALANAASINGDASRVALAGESAGGNLAVASAIGALAKGARAPSHILAVYPIANIDPSLESKIVNANAKPLNTPMLAWFGKHATRTPDDLKDPRINLVAANLTGLPPTTVITAEIDPLRTEGHQLAEKLKAAGVDVASRDFMGVTHEFFGMSAVLDEAKAAQQFAADRLKASLAKK